MFRVNFLIHLIPILPIFLLATYFPDHSLTSRAAAGGVGDQGLDDAVHRAPAGKHHHGLLVVVLTHTLPDAVDGLLLVPPGVAVGVGVAAEIPSSSSLLFLIIIIIIIIITVITCTRSRRW